MGLANISDIMEGMADNSMLVCWSTRKHLFNIDLHLHAMVPFFIYGQAAYEIKDFVCSSLFPYYKFF